MLVMQRLWAGAPRYFVAAVAPDGGDAPPRGEAPGRWAGAGARARGLTGVVEAADLRRVLPGGADRLAGFDLTFAAPKSVSVLHALGPPEVADAVRRAHDDAVTAGLHHLERHACAVRVRGDVVRAEGLVVAAFRHRTSRASDPHLHTHAVVANVAAPPDGGWRALHTPLLYAERRGAAATYHVVLRGRLTAELGLRWDAPRGGRADALAVPERVRAAFSRRRAAVLNEAFGELGERRWAERVTRADRSGLVDVERLTDGWHHRARVLSWVPLEARCGRVPRIGAVGDELLPAGDRWRRADLLVVLADHWVDGARAADIDAATRRLLASPEVVALNRGRFTTRVAQARALTVSMALRGRRVDGDPESLDRLRRRVALDGHGLTLVVADASAAERVQARVGARAVPSGRAAQAVQRLPPGDIVVIRTPERLPSAHVEAVLTAASGASIVVLAGSETERTVRVPTRSIDAPAVTVDAPGGDVTSSACAVTAADTAVDDWVARRRTGAAAVLVVDGEEVAMLNERARTALRRAGMLGRREVAGFATGDVIRFLRSHPARGIARGTRADVVGVDETRGTVDVRLDDSRLVNLGASHLRAVVHAHAVPPVALLVSGRGDVFVLGGAVIAGRHLGGNQLHRYVTADVPVVRPPRSHHLAAARPLDRGVGLSR